MKNSTTTSTARHAYSGVKSPWRSTANRATRRAVRRARALEALSIAKLGAIVATTTGAVLMLHALPELGARALGL